MTSTSGGDVVSGSGVDPDADPDADAAAIAALGALTEDIFLAGCRRGPLTIRQPRHGFRSGPDALFLAAAVPSGGTLLDLGCGAGVAMLAAARRRGDLSVTGVEVQPGYAALARANAAANGIAADVACADLAALPAAITGRRFDHVIANPPYYPPGTGKPASDAGRDLARAGTAPLSLWLDVASRRLAPGGWLVLIQRTDRLRDILSHLPPSVGTVTVLPLASRAGRAPDRLILRARKGGRGAFRLCTPLVLHAGPAHLRDAPDYGPAIDAVLRCGAELGGFD